jgi:ribonuclease HI
VLVVDFLSDRRQRIAFEGATSEWVELEDGVPQGSVLSCLLFLIYAYDAPRAPPHSGLSGEAAYADDFALWEAAPTVADAAASLQRRVDSFVEWACCWLIHVSPSKSVFSVFTRSRSAASQPVVLSVAGSELRRDKAPRYLGLQLTENLDWRPHIERTVQRCQQSLAAIRRLTARLGDRGACAPVVLQLYRALIQPVIEYAAPVWLSTTPSSLAPLERVQREVLVLASGAWRSASYEALCVDLNIEPLQLRLSKLLLRWEARILRLDADHPLRAVWMRDVHPTLLDPPLNLMSNYVRGIGVTMPQRLHWLHRALDVPLEVPERAEPLALRARHLPKAARPPLTVCPARDTAVKWFEQRQAGIFTDPDAVIVSTDGSFDDERRAGASAYCMANADGALVEQATGLGEMPCSSFSAELFAILLWLDDLRVAEDVIRDAAAPPSFHLFSDCRSVLEVLSGGAEITTYVSLYNLVVERLEWLHDLGCQLQLYWIPGHAGVPPNERVDQLAKEALGHEALERAQPLLEQVLVPFTFARAQGAARCAAAWSKRWAECPETSHLRAIKPVPTRAVHCWSASRERDRALCWLRLGTCLNAFLSELWPKRYLPYCEAGCRGPETVEHFLTECPRYAPQRSAMLHALRIALGKPELCEDDLTLGLLLGADAPSHQRREVGDIVFRFVRNCERKLTEVS